MLSKLVAILGTTASGKSDWAHKLAGRFDGEIVVADSRQVYKDFTIGTNKDIGELKESDGKFSYYVEGMPYHLVDIISPKEQFTVYDYQKRAFDAIDNILKRGKNPFLVGGTGMYVRAVVENWKLAKAPSEEALRKKLNEKPKISLLTELRAIDPERAKTIDMHNKRRLVRALEVYYLTGETLKDSPPKGEARYKVLKLAPLIPRDGLYRNIAKRVSNMFEKGLLEEVQKLFKEYPHDVGVFSSIGYRQFFPYFEGKATLEDVKEQIIRDTKKYARRQLTWFRKEKDLNWLSTYEEAEALVLKFFKTL